MGGDVFDALTLAATIASVIGYPLLIIACLFAVGVFRMMKEAENGYEITIKNWQGKFILCGLAAAGVCYAVDIADRFGGIAWLQSQMPITEVYDQTFMDQDVPVVGYGYHHCTFKNVTFIVSAQLYRIEFSNNTVDGATFRFTNQAAERAVDLLSDFGFVNLPRFLPNGRIEPPGSGLGGLNHQNSKP